MTPFVPFESTYARLLVSHVDTDQIIPARFLKTTSREGLGRYAFADWRYDAGQQPRADFPLHHPSVRGASVLLAGDNFGCGSSREHAPWALLDMGFRAVIAPSFGDIFRQNALKNALLPIVVGADVLATLAAAPPEAKVGIDLGSIGLAGGHRVPYPLDRFWKECLANGIDEIEYVLRQAREITRYETQAS
jgi:3-isopropylmalate/(R)-2-methylmalate dehydratase small subunit